MSSIKGPTKLKICPKYNQKRKDYNFLKLVEAYDLTFEEAKEIAKLALSGDKWARKVFKKA
jgi:hypothetical protein